MFVDSLPWWLTGSYFKTADNFTYQKMALMLLTAQISLTSTASHPPEIPMRRRPMKGQSKTIVLKCKKIGHKISCASLSIDFAKCRFSLINSPIENVSTDNVTDITVAEETPQEDGSSIQVEYDFCESG